MSTLRNPVGPKDRRVYIRRRLLVLAGLLAVVIAVVLIIVKPGSSGGAERASEVSVPADLVTEPAPADEEEGEDDVAACSPEQLAVTPITDQTSYAEGELPKFSLAVENTGESDCTADLGTAGMHFEVSSGSDQVWRSVDCQENPENLAVVLEAGQRLETEEVVWDRTRSSAETCDITRDAVAAGGASYHLRAAAAGVKGDGTAQFLLN